MLQVAPKPHHIRLGDYFFTLARRQDKTLEFERFPTPFFPDRVTERAVSQASFPAESRVPYAFGSLSGGFGLERQDTAEETDRYFYATARTGNTDEGVDASAGAFAILGPKLNRVTPAGFVPTDGHWFTLGTGLFLAATDGTNTRVYKWNTGTLTLDLQATIAGRVVTHATTYRGTQSQDYAYLAFGAGQVIKYSTDGVTWTDVTNAMRAQLFAKIDGELWRYVNANVASCGDGGTTPTFPSTDGLTGGIDIGDFMGTGNGLYNVNDRLVAGKSVGLFVLAENRASLEQNLWADLWENGPDADTFAGGIVWRGQLITRVKQGLVAISASYAANPIGWDQLAENDGEVHGVPTGLAGDHFHLYCTSASGHLMKGKATHAGDGSIESVAWHPVLYLGTTSKRSFVWNGTAGNEPQLFLLLANGQIGRAVLSKTGSPLTDSRYRFCPGGALVHPWLFAGFTAIDKLTFSIAAGAKNLSNNQAVQYGYKLPTTAAFTDLASAQTADPGVRQDLTTPATARAIQLRAVLTTNDETESPVLRTTTLDFLVQPDPLPSVQMVIDCRKGAQLADGSQQALEPSIAAERLEGMVSAGVKTFIDPWGRSLDVTIPLDGVRQVAGHDHDGQEPDLFVRVIARGQKLRERGTWDKVEQYDWDTVEDQFTWDDLPLSA
jgi:hypothetical protein